jgi:hypothetical protein
MPHREAYNTSGDHDTARGKKGGYTSVNLCVKQARPGGKVAEASDAPDVRRKEGMEERSDQGDPRGQQLVSA